MNELFWDRAVAFHGHGCPGLALGVRMCEYAKAQFGLDFSSDEQLVCVAETDSCVADAIQSLLGCTFGKGNLIYRPTGKTAFSFYHRDTGASIRIVTRPSPPDTDREARKQHILNAPLEALFVLTPVKSPVPEPARIFQTILCEICGEGVAEYRVHLQDGKHVCIDCFRAYDR